jgi:alkylhydroperoxidase family enzyme
MARRTGGQNLQRTRAPETGQRDYEISARHAQALGDGPRIEAIPNDQIGADAWSLVDTLRESAGAPPVDVMPEFMRLMAKHPPIFHRQMEMGNVLFNGRISPRDRELAVLRISWLAGAPFEWGEHVVISKRCGVTAEEIERVTQGSSAAGWSEHDAAILRGVEELVADFAISDQTWSVLAKSWDEPQLIEFPMMVGQYLTTAFLLNSLKVQLGAGNTGLAQR